MILPEIELTGQLNWLGISVAKENEDEGIYVDRKAGA